MHTACMCSITTCTQPLPSHNHTHTHTHTVVAVQTCMYMYMYVCMANTQSGNTPLLSREEDSLWNALASSKSPDSETEILLSAGGAAAGG